MLHTTILFLFINSLFWIIDGKHGRSCLYTNDDILKLTLPWGTYKGELYGEDGEVSK